MQIKQRDLNQEVYSACIKSGYPEIVARIIAGRRETFDKNIFEFTLNAIQPATTMVDAAKAAQRITKAIHNHETILLFTDYDVDGCTSMAILYGALHDIFGVSSSYIMKLTGHRTQDGYGLTATVAETILQLKPDLVITADAGTSDNKRIEKLADAGVDVIVTDHHLIPKEGGPNAALAVVNPQQECCPYDPHIAGCGVAWLLMTAVSQEMKCSIEQKQKLHQMLDYVALGTVADLVSLNSVTNRYFVKKGLEFMNRKIRACWRTAINDKEAAVGYLGFQLGPRINAASRMSGRPDRAIEFLLGENMDQVNLAYEELDQLNSSRQHMEKEMYNSANQVFTGRESAIIHYSEKNHAGIQGIVASKLSENFGVPAVMLAHVGNNLVAGSGRSGQFLHLRDALQTFDEQYPGIFISFGGHRAAAGLKIHKENIEIFKKGFHDIVKDQLKDLDITPYIKTDGSLKGNISLDTYYQIEHLKPFGMGFPSPTFFDEMVATRVRVMGKHPVHLAMMLDNYQAVFFNALNTPDAPWPIREGERVEVVYTLNLNQWQGRSNLQLMVKTVV